MAIALLLSLLTALLCALLLTLRMDLNSQRYAQPAARAQFGQQLVEKATAAPGVRIRLALGDWRSRARNLGACLPLLKGDPMQRQEDWLMAHRHNSHPSALRSLGIPLLRGRDFTWGDAADQPRVAIISESLARKHWPNEDAIGKRLQLQGRSDLTTVIGVTADARHIAAMRQTILSLDPNLPIYDIRTLDERLRAQEAPSRAVATLLSVYGALALLLAGLGLYGVLAHSVSQRTGEIGIRMALGAQRAHILRMIVGRGAKLIVAGALIGLGASLMLTRFLSGLLFGVSATDPLTFVGITLLLTIVALLACWLPARSATRVEPMVALRRE